MTVYTDGSESDDYVSVSAVFPYDILKVNLAVHTTIFTTEDPRGDAEGLSRDYVLRIPSVS